MRKHYYCLLMLLCQLMAAEISAQVGIGNGIIIPSNSAILEVRSSTRGLLIPRMSETEINLIQNPANGLQVFCTTDSKIYIFVSAEHRWKNLAYGNGELVLPATYTAGSGGTCSNTIVQGTYMINVALLSLNTITLEVDVATPGTWSAYTDTLNGYAFSGNGSFLTAGIQTITLTGSGTPLSVQTDIFTLHTVGSGGSCIFPVTVVPPPECGSPLSDPRDGKSYGTVLIYTQCWMAENLDAGTKIVYTSDQANNGIIEKYCYNNDEANCTLYGGLYQWAETVQYLNGASDSTTYNPMPSGPVTGICPPGWHVPSDEDWTILTTYLGGDSIAGGKMKEAGTSHWASPNTGATNSSGFTALPGGYRSDTPGLSGINTMGLFWSATSKDSSPPENQAWHRILYSSYELTYRSYNTKPTGYSVRCLKN